MLCMEADIGCAVGCSDKYDFAIVGVDEAVAALRSAQFPHSLFLNCQYPVPPPDTRIWSWRRQSCSLSMGGMPMREMHDLTTSHLHHILLSVGTSSASNAARKLLVARSAYL